ncbi:MAG: S49 family peptidase [Rheinheimera sp.]|nr:S49 family peptidase [Rheinheimera sp.]
MQTKLWRRLYAIVGSIGVIAQLPNFNKLLKKNHIDFEQLTAGEFKRTVTVFGENTDKGRQKFQQELEETHVLFKHFVKRHRQQLEIDEVATGEHWFGYQALELKLVDELTTSDDYLADATERASGVQSAVSDPQIYCGKTGTGCSDSAEKHGPAATATDIVAPRWTRHSGYAAGSRTNWAGSLMRSIRY